MTEKQRSLSLGFGPVHWEGLPPETRAKVLDLWIQLLRDHVERQKSGCGTGEGP
jgi:hypothetical protein